MADENAIQSLGFDARPAKQGAADFKTAGEAVIATNKKVVDAENAAAKAVETAEGRKTTARKGASAAAAAAAGEEAKAVKAAADGVESATSRVVQSYSSQQRFLDGLARRFDPFAQEVRKATGELNRLQGIAAGVGPNAERAAGMLVAAQNRVRDAELALAQSRQQAANASASDAAKVVGGYDRILAVARQMVPVLGAMWAVDKMRQVIGDIAKAGDAWASMSARASQAGVSIGEIYASAQRTGTALDDNVKSIQRLGLAAKDFGATGGEIARVTETVTKLGRVSNASAQEMSAGLQQLAQALASGRLGGDELRSILENMPAVARQIADGLGLSVGRLREMGAAGQLTAEKVFGSLLAGSNAADAAFARMPVTLEQAGQRVTNSFTRVGAAIDNSTGLSRLLARGMQNVSDVVDTLARRIEGDLTQRIKDLNTEIDRLQRKAPVNDNAPAGMAVSPGGAVFGNPNLDRQGRRIRAQIAQPLIDTRSILQEQSAAMRMEELMAQAAERAANGITAANKKMTDGLGDLFKALGLVVENGKLMTAEQVVLGKATAALAEATKRGDDALKPYSLTVAQATSLLERMKEKVDPLEKAMKALREEADILAAPAGFERNLAQQVQKFQNEMPGATPADIAAARERLRGGVQDRAIAGTIDAAEQARRQAESQEVLAAGAGKTAAAMRAAERTVQLLARGYELGLNPAQMDFIRTNGRLPDLVGNVGTAMRDYNAQLGRGDAAKAAAEAKEFGAGATAAARGAMLVAQAAGEGEAAQRAAAAAAAVLNERNFQGAEAARQRALEEAKVLEITNETVRTLARDTAANEAMAAAILKGVDAVEAETRAQYERAMALKLGADRQKELAAVMAAYDQNIGSKRVREAAQETVDLQRKAEATRNLAAAVGLGAEAMADAQLKNELLSMAQAKGLKTVEELATKYPDLVKAKKDDIAATQELAVKNELLRSSQEKLTAGLKAQAAAISDPAVRRQAELTIERMQKIAELNEKFTNPADRAKLLSDFDATQAYREMERFYGEQRQRAEGWANDVSTFLLDGFVNAAEGGKSTFKSLWDGALQGLKRFALQIPIEILKQKVILPIAMQLVGAVPGLMGIAGPQQAAGSTFTMAQGPNGTMTLTPSGGGVGLPSINLGGGNAPGGWLGDAWAWANKPFNIGGTLTADPIGGGMDTYAGGIDISPMDIAGPILSALPGLLNGNYIQAGLGAGGFVVGNLILPGVGGPIGGFLGNLLGGLFKKKPSNEGAEVSFSLDDYSDFFRSTKHANRVAQVDAYTEGLQEGLNRAASRYGVGFGPGAVVGSTFGKAEGSRFFFDAGSRDGGIENRVWADFQAGNEESTRAAAEKVIVAAIKDGFVAAAEGDEITQAGRDVATAMANSVAETFDQLDKDLLFARSFDDFVKIGQGTFDPVAASLRKAVEDGKAYAAGIVEQGRAFRQQAEDLGLGTEELENGLTRADTATRGYILSLFENEKGLSATTLEIVKQKSAIAALETEIQQFNITAEEAATITARLTQELQDGFVAGLQNQINDIKGLGFLNTLQSIREEFRANSDSAWQLGVGMEKVHELSGLRIEALVREVAAGDNAVANLGLLRAAFVEIGWSTQAVDNALAGLGQTMGSVVGALMATNQAAIGLGQAQAALMGKSYVPGSATELVYGAIGGSNAQFNTLGQGIAPNFFSTIDGLLAKARGGSLTQSDLDAFATTNLANQAGYGRWTSSELLSIAQAVGGLLQGQSTNYPSAGTGSTGGTGSSGSDDSSTRKLIEDMEKSRKPFQDAASAAERLRDSLLGAADGLRLYRLGLLTDPSVSPYSIADQLKEAQRQQLDAYMRVQAGGEGAVDAARELQTTTDRVLSLGKSVYGNSAQYNALFTSSTQMLEAAQQAAVNYAAQQLTALNEANRQLDEINRQIEILRGELNTDNGSTGNPGTPSTPPTTTPPPTGPSLPPPANQNYDFGYRSLGRIQGESADAFIRRMFPGQASAIAGTDGLISEAEGYNWSIATHPIGLKDANGAPLTNAGYFGAARSGGYSGAFSSGGHLAWLNSEPSGILWRAFIDELRTKAVVEKGFFDTFGAPKGYLTGGLITGGIPGVDSVPIIAAPGERIFSSTHSRIIEGLAARGSNDNREMVSLTRKLIDQNETLIKANAYLRAEMAENKNATREGNEDRRAIRGIHEAGRAHRQPVGRAASGRKAA